VIDILPWTNGGPPGPPPPERIAPGGSWSAAASWTSRWASSAPAPPTTETRWTSSAPSGSGGRAGRAGTNPGPFTEVQRSSA